MEIIYKERGKGKTTDLIKLSAEKGYYIVCKGRDESQRIASQAIEMGLSIPLPITFNEFLCSDYGYCVKGFLIDNADILLSHLGRGRVKAATLTKPSQVKKYYNATGTAATTRD